MTLSEFLDRLEQAPASVSFDDTMAVIDDCYEFTPTAFRNGTVVNAAGENNGSCRIFAFAKRHDLSEASTLACFGAYYRDDVLENPDGKDHQNIREFMRSGWSGVEFEADPLQEKS